MEDSKKEKLEQAGVDIASALDRFMGNEQLLLKFLKKFHQDPNYDLLKETIANKEYEEAFKAAHTLKGVCGNLSLNVLFKIVSEEVEFLRNGHYSEAEEVFPKVQEEYERIVEILDAL